MKNTPLDAQLTLLCFVLLSLAQTLSAAEPTVYHIADFGALPDGTTNNTAAIQKAIDTCSTAGGGVLHFPKGRYLTGTIQLKDNVTLHLDDQATLLGSTDAATYRNLDPFKSGDGAELGYAMIVAIDAKNVGIEGAGTIDGQGTLLKAAQKTYTIRPFLIRWLRCTDVTVKDIHLTNSGAWTLTFFQSKNIAIDRVTIRSRGLTNNDGIDLDSCQSAAIHDCDIDSGDDAICLKATSPTPCRDITASGCKLRTSCNGIKLGTESLGDFEKIRISKCELRDIGMSGIALYSVDGAHLTDVAISDITIKGVAVPISIRLGARLKTFRPGDIAKQPGIIRDVTIDNVQATAIKQIGMLINGVANHPIESLTLSNIHIELPGGGTDADAKVQLAEKPSSYPEMSMFGKIMPASGMYVRHVRGVTFKDVQTTLLKPDARPEKVFIDVESITPATFGPVKAP